MEIPETSKSFLKHKISLVKEEHEEEKEDESSLSPASEDEETLRLSGAVLDETLLTRHRQRRKSREQRDAWWKNPVEAFPSLSPQHSLEEPVVLAAAYPEPRSLGKQSSLGAYSDEMNIDWDRASMDSRIKAMEWLGRAKKRNRMRKRAHWTSDSEDEIMLLNWDEDGYVGFSRLPEQIHRKAVKRGFDFTLMVVGESGLGKSTLISSLFLSDLYKGREVLTVQERIAKTVQIEKKYMEIEEKGVKLRLTIVDTPGFNDSVNGEDSWKTIESYIDQQFEQYFKDETGLNRKNIKDNRVHCCLYFISPFGHGEHFRLKPMDTQFMRHLHQKVNIVPIIAKADTLTYTELRKLKVKVLEQIEEHKIQIYEFPDCDSDEDEDFKQQDRELKATIPFAVIGSNTIVEVNGRRVRGRLYPWGIVEVDNPDHCDFGKLRMMLISTHMQDLKDVTQDVHYENYRARAVKEQMIKSQGARNKLKRDSSPNFEAIMDADRLLQAKDEEIRRMQEMLVKMQKQLSAKSGTVNGKA